MNVSCKIKELRKYYDVLNEPEDTYLYIYHLQFIYFPIMLVAAYSLTCFPRPIHSEAKRFLLPLCWYH